ncbi:17475_t:CDS:1, partial [Gigaspora rosea]
KLLKKFVFDVIAKADATMQYKIIKEKFMIRIFHRDLYNAINKFCSDSASGEEDARILLRRLHEKNGRSSMSGFNKI